jgi:hypothetical protein
VLDVKSDKGNLLAMPARYPNPWSCAPYPQLNPNMDVNYLSRLIDGSKFHNPFPPIGVPPVPHSTPVAGMDSLPFIYGGKMQAPAPSSGPTPSKLIIAPSKDSPWIYGQVGDILRKTMARQEKQLAAMAVDTPRVPKQLNTPPPAATFGSGLLYLENPRRSTVEPVPPSKLSLSDVQWYHALGQPIPPEELEGELKSGVKEELEKRNGGGNERYDGMPMGGRRDHPAVLSPALPPPGYCPPHFRGMVESGPVERLNTRWDKELQVRLVARDESECEEEYRTTQPLRIVDKQQRRCEVVSRRDEFGAQSPMGAQGQWEMGVCFVPAPCTLPEHSRKVGWFGKLVGKKSQAGASLSSRRSMQK